MSEDALAPIAAVVYAPTDPIEPLLVDLARILRERGVRLGGALQHDAPATAGAPHVMELEILGDGSRFALSQALGSGAEACRLDPDALARAGVAVRAAVDTGTDLIIINKFGGQEACGSGLRTEMALAAVAGIPLLTAVGERFLPEWQDFSGGAATRLPPELGALLAWCGAVLGPTWTMTSQHRRNDP